MDEMGPQRWSWAAMMENHYLFDVVLANHYLLADCEVIGSELQLDLEIMTAVVRCVSVTWARVTVVHDEEHVVIVDGHYEDEGLTTAMPFVDALVNLKAKIFGRC